MRTRSRRLPTFLVIGAMKAGTTSLYWYLAAHPEVFMSTPKELDFFVEELNWRRGARWYEERFDAAPASAKAVGEASTSYTKHPRYRGVPERVARILPDVRLLYVVRDPVDRIRSHYEHNVVLGEEADPIDRAVRRNPAYLDYSRYAAQLERWLEWFPRERLLVLTAESLRTRRRETVAAALSFVGVDASVEVGGLDVEHYRTGERRRYAWPVALVRNAARRIVPDRPGLWRGTFVPERIKRGLTTRALNARVVVPDETARWIRAQLADDDAALRSFVPGFDGWEATGVVG